MLKALVVLALASATLVQDAKAESLVRRTDAQERAFQSFLPPASPVLISVILALGAVALSGDDDSDRFSTA
jgi:hypothetical protein